MKKSNTTKQQKGFFDFGFSLAVLALSGAFAYAATPAEEDRTATQDPQIQVVANLQADNKSLYLQR